MLPRLRFSDGKAVAVEGQMHWAVKLSNMRVRHRKPGPKRYCCYAILHYTILHYTVLYYNMIYYDLVFLNRHSHKASSLLSDDVDAVPWNFHTRRWSMCSLRTVAPRIVRRASHLLMPLRPQSDTRTNGYRMPCVAVALGPHRHTTRSSTSAETARPAWR